MRGRNHHVEDMIFIVPTDMPPNEVRGRNLGMKIDRLIGILSELLHEEKTTAPELAERFEVSRICARQVFLYRQRREPAVVSALWTDTGWTGRF